MNKKDIRRKDMIIRILKNYAEQEQVKIRSTSDLSPLEGYLLKRLSSLLVFAVGDDEAQIKAIFGDKGASGETLGEED